MQRAGHHYASARSLCAQVGEIELAAAAMALAARGGGGGLTGPWRGPNCVGWPNDWDEREVTRTSVADRVGGRGPRPRDSPRRRRRGRRGRVVQLRVPVAPALRREVEDVPDRAE